MAAIELLTDVPYMTHSALWDELLCNDPVQYPLGFPLDQEYSRTYAPNKSFRDVSLIAMMSGRPVAGLQITQSAPSTDFFGRPALLRVNATVSPDNREKAEKLLAEEVLKNHDSLDYLELCQAGSLSAFAVRLLKEDFIGTPAYSQILDLSQDEDVLRRNIRKSYRSLINWGDKNLDIKVHDGSTAGTAIEEFRRLHIAVAGRETRPAESWSVQHRQIEAGQAFLITGEMDGKLVTGALFLLSSLYCYYGVGASVREMFDKPLSHAILWHSVLEAKQRGCRLYEMGEMSDLYQAGYSEKERNIAVFKRGFGGSVHLRLRIRKS
jgi:hypothetical protein